MSTLQENGDGDAKYSFQIADLDGECRDILRAIFEADGQATTPFIQKQAAVGRQQTHYRLDKLEERGLVSTYTAKPEGGGQAVTHATLSDEGREAIEAGLLEDITDANASLKQLRQEIEELRGEVEQKADRGDLGWELDALSNDLRDLQREVKVVDSREDLDDLQESVAAIGDRVDRLANNLATIESELETVRGELGERATDERVTESVDTLNEKIEALRDEVDTDIAHAAASVHRHVDALDEELADAERVEDVEADLRDVQRQLAEQDATQDVQELREAVDHLAETLAPEARVETVEERIVALEDTAEKNSKRSRRNQSRLTKGNDHYSDLPKADRREWWLEKASENVNELGCSHASDAETWELLAHLEDAELVLVEQEDLFEERILRTARLSNIPKPCVHGWTFKLFGNVPVIRAFF